MIIRFISAAAIKRRLGWPWKAAWKKPTISLAHDLFYTVVFIVIVLTAIALAACAQLEPNPPADLPTKDDIQAAQTMREMNGFHSGRIEE